MHPSAGPALRAQSGELLLTVWTVCCGSLPATKSLCLGVRRKVGVREGFAQEGASQRRLFLPEKGPQLVCAPVPAPQGVTFLTVDKQPPTREILTNTSFLLPCLSVLIGCFLGDTWVDRAQVGLLRSAAPGSLARATC